MGLHDDRKDNIIAFKKKKINHALQTVLTITSCPNFWLIDNPHMLSSSFPKTSATKILPESHHPARTSAFADCNEKAKSGDHGNKKLI